MKPKKEPAAMNATMEHTSKRGRPLGRKDGPGVKGKRGRPAGMVKTDKAGELSKRYLNGKLDVPALSAKSGLSIDTIYKAIKGTATEKTRTILAGALGVKVEKI